MALAVALNVMPVLRLRGENHFDYKFENYQEENGRIHVQTQGALFGYQVHPSVSLEGEFVYDSISGATPNGVLPPPGTDQVVLQQMEDTRWAGNLQAGLHWGRNTTTPQFAYSLESDYESIGLALNHTIDFNEKNTTVAFGVAYTHDTIMPIFWGGDRKYKNGADFLIGLTQLLGSKTILTANLTYGTAHGFLSDPYKVVHVPYYPDPLNPDPFAYRNEQRPNYRNKYIGFLALTQFVTPLNGSAELGYRLYHDSYGILSHTASLTWYQKIGKNIIVSPTFRFTDQSAADFYILQLPGDPAGDPPFFAPLPKHFSADYRLSALQTFTYGIGVTWKIKDRVSLDLAYKRYEMVGKDNKTSASAYPSANVFSAGLRVWL